jgi:hypothetical protein
MQNTSQREKNACLTVIRGGRDKERLKYFHYLNRAEIRKNGQVIGITMGKIQLIGEDISTPADLTTTSESKTDPR